MAVEETPGLVRPVGLNRFGRVVHDPGLPDPRPGRGRPRRLLMDYLRRCLSDTLLHDHARAVLRSRVPDDHRTGQQTPAPSRSSRGRRGSAVTWVSGCLLRLEQKGLVRCVDEAEDLWAISHDFVARLLGQLVAGWRETPFRRIGPWLVPGSIVLWLLMVAPDVRGDRPARHPRLPANPTRGARFNKSRRTRASRSASRLTGDAAAAAAYQLEPGRVRQTNELAGHAEATPARHAGPEPLPWPHCAGRHAGITEGSTR